MKAAVILYDGVTLLDFAGLLDPISRLETRGLVPGFSCEVCAMKETVRTFEGIRMHPGRAGGDLASYEYVLVPGGNGVMPLMKDRAFLDWLSTSRGTIAAVCGGALLLGAAGLLAGRRATTHPALCGVLGKFAGEVTHDRIVEDGRIITAGGVTAAIDLGLAVCEKIAGRGIRETVQAQMDYHAYPYA